MNTERTVRINEAPTGFKREVLDSVSYADNFLMVENNRDIIINDLEQQKLDKIIEVLGHPSLRELIDEEKVTFAAIKPRTENSKLGIESDSEGESAILSLIEYPLIPIFQIALTPSGSDLDKFYPNELRERLSNVSEGNSNVWDLFKKHMLSGPTTYMLLYSEQGDAVNIWRRQIGVTNPETAEKNTIRGRYALDTRRNLVHGSSGDDSEERVNNVRTETKWLYDQLVANRNGIKNAELDSQFLKEKDFKELGIILPNEKLFIARRLFPFKRGGAESFISAYSLAVENQNGDIDYRFIVQKSIVSFTGSKQKAEIMFKRLQMLEKAGVEIPKLYGIRGADLFQEFILNAKSCYDGIDIIKSEDTSWELKEKLINQLVQMAYVLDSKGFKPLNFPDDIVFDRNRFIFLDAGSDLGGAIESDSNRVSFNQLMSQFKKTEIASIIEEKYRILCEKE